MEPSVVPVPDMLSLPLTLDSGACVDGWVSKVRYLVPDDDHGKETQDSKTCVSFFLSLGASKRTVRHRSIHHRCSGVSACMKHLKSANYEFLLEV